MLLLSLNFGNMAESDLPLSELNVNETLLLFRSFLMLFSYYNYLSFCITFLIFYISICG